MMPPRHPSQAALRRAEAATWGAIPPLDPAPRPEPKRMRLIAWKPLVKNGLRGFATVLLPIAWASLPSKPQLDQDGQHKRDVNGKAAYSPILEWKDRDLSDRFSQAVVALVRAEYPDLFEGEP